MSSYLETSHLAGAVFSPSEKKDGAAQNLSRRKRIMALLFRGKTFSGQDSVYGLGTTMGWSLVKAQSLLQKQLGGKSSPALISTMSAYTRGEPISLDLVTAVLRQGIFIEKMLGWTIPGRFDRDETILMRADVDTMPSSISCRALLSHF